MSKSRRWVLNAFIATLIAFVFWGWLCATLYIWGWWAGWAYQISKSEEQS